MFDCSAMRKILERVTKAIANHCRITKKNVISIGLNPCLQKYVESLQTNIELHQCRGKKERTKRKRVFVANGKSESIF